MSDYAVGGDGVGQRLDVFLAARAEGVSRAKIQKLIADGAVTLNEAPAKAKELLAEGDRVRVVWTAPPPSTLAPVELPLDILFEDDQIIVLNKPLGLSVHPGAGDTGATLVQGLLFHCGRLGAASAPPGVPADPTAWARPGIVHRLDKDTTGVMVAAKTDKAHAALARQFHDKTKMVREYVALLDGTLAAPQLTHESYLYRDPKERLRFASQPTPPPGTAARHAKSVFSREAVYGHRLTLARVRLFTGRTHQIRVHAKDLGAPVVGDALYGRRAQLPLSFPPEVRAALAGVTRQLLHARTLGFLHPATGEAVLFEAPIPADFASVLAVLAPWREA